MGSAETGSGKTAAFALPAIQLCYEEKTHKKAKPRRAGPASTPEPPSSFEYVMSSTDRDGTIAIDPSSQGLTVQSRDAVAWSGCRCSVGVAGKAKFYFECHIRDEGIVRVGWSTIQCSLELGTDSDSYGYGGTGMKVTGRKYDEYNGRTSFSKGDVVGCCLDLIGGEVSFSKNGNPLGKAFDVVKVGSIYFPTICVKNAECQMNFGGSDFQCLPDGFIGVAQAGEMASPNPLALFAANKGGKGPFAIVIEPTRDLAEQTFRVFEDLANRVPKPSVSAALLVGGTKSTQTMKLLEKNQVDVLVGTPPILASCVKKGTINTGRCNMFILDEADELISTDSVQHINSIYSRLAAIKGNASQFDRLQVCFFSATLHSKEVRSLSDKLCQRPMWVDLRGQNDSIVPDTVHNCVVLVDPAKYTKSGEDSITDSVHRGGKLNSDTEWKTLNDEEVGSERIKQLKPRILTDIIDKFKMDQVLVFCRTNLDCDLLEKYLKARGGGGMTDKYTCRVLAGMRSMPDRQKALREFKAAEARILICTDVAARGIDIRELPFVINLTLPDKPETYVHRIGRVGRAERMGLAISIVGSENEKGEFSSAVLAFLRGASDSPTRFVSFSKNFQSLVLSKQKEAASSGHQIVRRRR